MTGDFNIRDYSWNLNFCFLSIYKDILLNIANFFYLEMSESTNHILTKYSNNQQKLDSVINLMFLKLTSLKHDNHLIYPDWCLTFDYILLTVNITILKEDIQMRKHTIIKNNKEEDNFIIDLIKAIKRLNMKNIQSKEVLEHIIQSFADCIEWIWYKHLRVVNITKHSKEWWIIAEIWSFIDKPGGLMIRNNSRRQNTIFLI